MSARLKLSKVLTTLRHPRGTTAVEYLVALLLIAMVFMAITKLFGQTIYEKFDQGEERISEIDKSDEERSMEGGSDRVVASADESSGGGAGGGRGRSYSRRSGTSRAGSGSGRGGEDGGEGEDELGGDRGGVKGYRASGSGADEGGGRGRKESGPRGDLDRRRHLLPGEKPEVEPGFNPFIIFLILLIVGFLAYIIIKGNKEGG